MNILIFIYYYFFLSFNKILYMGMYNNIFYNQVLFFKLIPPFSLNNCHNDWWGLNRSLPVSKVYNQSNYIYILNMPESVNYVNELENIAYKYINRPEGAPFNYFIEDTSRDWFYTAEPPLAFNALADYIWIIIRGLLLCHAVTTLYLLYYQKTLKSLISILTLLYFELIILSILNFSSFEYFMFFNSTALFNLTHVTVIYRGLIQKYIWLYLCYTSLYTIQILFFLFFFNNLTKYKISYLKLAMYTITHKQPNLFNKIIYYLITIGVICIVFSLPSTILYIIKIKLYYLNIVFALALPCYSYIYIYYIIAIIILHILISGLPITKLTTLYFLKYKIIHLKI